MILEIKPVEDIEFIKGYKIAVFECVDLTTRNQILAYPTLNYGNGFDDSIFNLFRGYIQYLMNVASENFYRIEDGTYLNPASPYEVIEPIEENSLLSTRLSGFTSKESGQIWENTFWSEIILNNNKYVQMKASIVKKYASNGQLLRYLYSYNNSSYSWSLIRFLENGIYYYILARVSCYYYVSTNTQNNVSITIDFPNFTNTSVLFGNLIPRTFYTQDYIYSIGTPVPIGIDDPYSPGGNSGENTQPPGTFDDSSDPIPDSPIPTLSMAATGFTRIFNPTLSQLNDLAQYLWKEDTITGTLWNNIKNVMGNPIDVMIALNLVPVSVPNSSPVDFTVLYNHTGVMISPATTQFVDIDCGTCSIQGYYGSALDYSPYTKIHAYLPYIGMVSLDTDEVMNNTLHIIYRVDIVSGGCVAKILVDGNVLYQYSGHCSESIPFSAADFSQYLNAMLQVSAAAVGAAAGVGGAAMAMEAASDLAQQTGRTSKRTSRTNVDAVSGRTSHQDVLRVQNPNGDVDVTEVSYGGISPANIANTVGQVIGSKPTVQHSGSFNGNTGYLGVRYPYIIMEVPRQCLPSSYQTMNGYPSMITLKLGDCTGYTKVQQVLLTGITATNPEQAEILQLLKGGVIF